MSSTKSLRALILGAPLALCLASAAAQAKGIDGSENLLCFAASTTHCESGGVCENLSAEDVDLPKFFRLDFTAMTVSRQTGEDTQRSSKIASLTKDDNGLVLQGAEEGLGWTLLVDPQGNMSLSASRDGEGFVIFGACATLN